MIELMPLQYIGFNKRYQRYGIFSCNATSTYTGEVDIIMLKDHNGDVWHRHGFKVTKEYMELFTTYNDII